MVSLTVFLVLELNKIILIRVGDFLRFLGILPWFAYLSTLGDGILILEDGLWILRDGLWALYR